MRKNRMEGVRGEMRVKDLCSENGSGSFQARY